VPNLAPGTGRADRASTTVVIPSSVPPGTYFIVACADGPGTSSRATSPTTAWRPAQPCRS
jgi:hypothetical protein